MRTGTVLDATKWGRRGAVSYRGAMAIQVSLTAGSVRGSPGLLDGMIAARTDVVHRDVADDLAVDTTHTEATACTQAVAAHVR